MSPSWNLEGLDPDEVEEAYRQATKRFNDCCLFRSVRGELKLIACRPNNDEQVIITEMKYVAAFWSEMFSAYMDYCEENYVC